MKNKLLGIVISLFLLTSCEKLVVNHRFNKDEIAQPTASCPESEVGRFQIVINKNIRADTFLLDTKTGRIWQNTTFTDLKGEPTVWDEKFVLGNKLAGIMGTYEFFEVMYPNKNEKKPTENKDKQTNVKN